MFWLLLQPKLNASLDDVYLAEFPVHGSDIHISSSGIEAHYLQV